MATPSAVLTQLQNVLVTMPLGRRVSLAATLLAAVGGFGALLWWSTQASFVPLMTGLTAEDASAIVEKLAAAKVPYQIGAGGSTIMVPETQVYELRLKIAGEGLPRGSGVGFEIFNEPGLGVDRFTEELNYQRALEGELQRTLRSLESVRDARVHVVLPKKSLFERKEDRARASVTIHLFPGRQLGGEQVQAVVHLVASAVSGLAPEDVTVVDGAGTVLAKGGDQLAALGQGIAQQRAIERNLEGRVVDILERVVGVGRVAVRVNATLDYAQRENTTESYDPEGAVVRSEQTSEEENGSAGNGAASGVPGARSNLAGAPTPAGTSTGTGSHTGRHVQTRNYEITKAIRHEVQPVGVLQRISAAVLVDGVRKAAADGTTTYSERTPEEMNRLKGLVQKAVGYDPKRGDEIEVQSMAFEPTAIEAADASKAPSVWLPLVIRLWPGLLATAALVGFVVLASRRRNSSSQALVPVPSTVREIEAMMGAPRLGAGPGVGTAPALMAPQTAAPATRPDPAHAAAVIKSWLAES